MPSSMRRRIARLEVAWPAPRPPLVRYNAPDELWLALDEEFGRHGEYASIPELPSALAYYREAIARARTRINPPFDPPPDYLPDESRGSRVRRWRMTHDFPEVRRAWQRVHDLIEPLSPKRPPPTNEEADALLRKLQQILQERRREMVAPCGPS